MKVSQSQMEQLKSCKSTDDIIRIAKEQGRDISQEDAEKLLVNMQFQELDEDSLNIVSGGCGTKKECPYCHSTDWDAYTYESQAKSGFTYHCFSCKRDFNDFA